MFIMDYTQLQHFVSIVMRFNGPKIDIDCGGQYSFFGLLKLTEKDNNCITLPTCLSYNHLLVSIH